jgi:hypothetical protein
VYLHHPLVGEHVDFQRIVRSGFDGPPAGGAILRIPFFFISLSSSSLRFIVKSRINSTMHLPSVPSQEFVMKNILEIIVITILGLIIISANSQAIAGDKKITKKDVPVAVLKAFTDAYPKAKVIAYAKEIEKGETFYELETVDGSLRRDLLYKADGTVAEVEEILAPKTLPAAIAKTIMTEMPKAKIISGEKTTRGTDVWFEVVVASGKEKVRVFLNADGKIQKKSVMKAKKENEEEKEEEGK